MPNKAAGTMAATQKALASPACSTCDAAGRASIAISDLLEKDISTTIASSDTQPASAAAVVRVSGRGFNAPAMAEESPNMAKCNLNSLW